MKKNIKIIVAFIICIVSMFSSCQENKRKMVFSFEQIQDVFYKEMRRTNVGLFDLFYYEYIF